MSRAAVVVRAVVLAIGAADLHIGLLAPAPRPQIGVVVDEAPLRIPEDDELVVDAVALEADRRALHLRFLTRKRQQLRQPVGVRLQLAGRAAAAADRNHRNNFGAGGCKWRDTNSVASWENRLPSQALT